MMSSRSPKMRTRLSLGLFAVLVSCANPSGSRAAPDAGDAPPEEAKGLRRPRPSSPRLELNDSIYYRGNEIEITITAGKSGIYGLRERGADAAGFLFEGALEARQKRVLKPQLADAPGLHELELVRAETETATLAAAPVVAEASFHIRGPKWSRLEAIQTTLGQGGLELETNSESFEVGDKLKLTVTATHSGYLMVLVTEPTDAVRMVFPNAFVPAPTGRFRGWVGPGTNVIPSKKMDFDLVTRPPRGDNQVLAFLSPAPILDFDVLSEPGIKFLTLTEKHLKQIEAACAPVNRRYPPIKLERVDLVIE